MNIAYAILVVAAVGVALIVQRQLHQRQRNEAIVAQIHHDWLTHLTNRPHLAKLWMPEWMDEEVDEKKFVELINANQQACALALRDRLGLARGKRLDFMTKTFMEKEVGRGYWAACGGYREEEATGDRSAKRFSRSMRKAFNARLDTGPESV
ncbi:DUF6082 family protein [Streptomyces botrytidirepellens]|uniref:Uncharacterized protein n=1 Tax=Streptomyces botrytidirepellens TaxID=2486417 RepID=A0A3M8W9K0_9ACTN|nr:DUF6082 family protein [Streptomyces botrytidirepellens]RNG26220.1 hypothetical protein EEJ42_15555 [Streptomyces botrytidirepellens]